MREIALHILDLAQNSINAKADNIKIEVDEDENGFFAFTISDDGCGMSAEMVAKVRDPFTTTRTTRKVGMGIPFMDMVTERCGGRFDITSEVGVGTTMKATFEKDNIDIPPLGDLASSIAVLLAGGKKFNLIFSYKNGDETFVFTTDEVREILGEDIEFSNPEVYAWLEDYLRQNIDMLRNNGR